MQQEWMSVEVTEYRVSGTTVHRGVFPASSVPAIQIASCSAIMAQIWESVDLVTKGVLISIDISFSCPQSVELDDVEAALIEKYKKKKGADRWDRSFYPPNSTKV